MGSLGPLKRSSQTWRGRGGGGRCGRWGWGRWGRACAAPEKKEPVAVKRGKALKRGGKGGRWAVWWGRWGRACAGAP